MADLICVNACGGFAVATDSCSNDAAFCPTCITYMHALWPACPCCHGPLIRDIYVVPESTPEPIYP